jgi:hypothetical protein
MTETKKQALYGRVAYHWSGKALTERGQHAVVDATIREWEAEKAERPNEEPREWIIRNRVKFDRNVRMAIPWPIIISIVGWLISFIIDWLKKDMVYSTLSQRFTEPQ